MSGPRPLGLNLPSLLAGEKTPHSALRTRMLYRIISLMPELITPLASYSSRNAAVSDNITSRNCSRLAGPSFAFSAASAINPHHRMGSRKREGRLEAPPYHLDDGSLPVRSRCNSKNLGRAYRIISHNPKTVPACPEVGLRPLYTSRIASCPIRVYPVWFADAEADRRLSRNPILI